MQLQYSIEVNVTAFWNLLISSWVDGFWTGLKNVYSQPLQKDLSIQFSKSEMLKRWEKRMRNISVRSAAFVSALWHSCMCFPSAVWKIYFLSSFHVSGRPVLSGLQEEGMMQILAGKQHECCWAEESSREERVANQSSELVHGILHLEIQQIRLVNMYKIKIKI